MRSLIDLFVCIIVAAMQTALYVRARITKGIFGCVLHL